MREQITAPVTISTPTPVEEVWVALNDDDGYVVRREPHPDSDEVWITLVIHDRVTFNEVGNDIHTRVIIDGFDDDASLPLDEWAMRWMHNRIAA
jgi:hypothetical protein